MKIDGIDTYSGMAAAPTATSTMDAKKLEEDKKTENEKVNPTPQQVNPADEIEPDELLGILDQVNKFAEVQNVNLRLKVDDDSFSKVIISVIDQETEEIIRQIPSEHALRLAKNIDESLKEFFSPGNDSIINLLRDEA